MKGAPFPIHIIIPPCIAISLILWIFGLLPEQSGFSLTLSLTFLFFIIRMIWKYKFEEYKKGKELSK